MKRNTLPYDKEIDRIANFYCLKAIEVNKNKTIAVDTTKISMEKYIELTNFLSDFFDIEKPIFKLPSDYYMAVYRKTNNPYPYNTMLGLFKRITSEEAKKTYAMNFINKKITTYPDFQYFFFESSVVNISDNNDLKRFAEEVVSAMQSVVNSNAIPEYKK